MSEENNLIYLSDDDGNEEAYSFLDLIEYDGCDYAVLYPQEGEDEGTVVILRVEDLNEEEDAYIPVEEEDILDTVFELFKERNQDLVDKE